MEKTRNHMILLLLVWLAALGAFIRVWGLWHYAFSPDEVMLAMVPTGDSLRQVWTDFRDQTNAPFMYMAAYAFMKISYNELIVRCMSLIPGVLLISMFYLLGATVSGPVSGLTMAALAAFSSGAILMSQVVRPYSLLLFFLTGAIWCFSAYFNSHNKKYLYGYALFAAFSVMTHYPAVIPLTAIGVVWLLHTILQKKPAKEFVRVIGANLPAVIIFTLLYAVHVYYQTGEKHVYAAIRETYLAPLFPSSFAGLLSNMYDLFWYLLLPPYHILFMILAVAGVIVLWRSSRRSLVFIIVSTFALNGILTCFKQYPFGGSRHSIYLFPLLAVPAGAAVQGLWSFLREKVTPVFTQKTAPRENSFTTLVPVMGVLAVLCITPVIIFSFRQSDFLRSSRGSYEFPLRSDSLHKFYRYLGKHLQPRDVIVTNFKSLFYLRYALLPHTPEIRILPGTLYTFPWNGVACYYGMRYYNFEKLEYIEDIFYTLPLHPDVKKTSKLWLVNIGWDADEIELFLQQQPRGRSLINREFSSTGVCLHSAGEEVIVQHYRGVFKQYLAEHMRPQDTALTDGYGMAYFIDDLLPAEPDITYAFNYCWKLMWRGHVYFSFVKYNFTALEEVIGSLDGIRKAADLKQDSRVWVVSMGSPDGIETLLQQWPASRDFVKREFCVPGGCIYSVSSGSIAAIVARYHAEQSGALAP